MNIFDVFKIKSALLLTADNNLPRDAGQGLDPEQFSATESDVVRRQFLQWEITFQFKSSILLFGADSDGEVHQLVNDALERSTWIPFASQQRKASWNVTSRKEETLEPDSDDAPSDSSSSDISAGNSMDGNSGTSGIGLRTGHWWHRRRRFESIVHPPLGNPLHPTRMQAPSSPTKFKTTSLA